jgi:hypothetical protein
MIEIVKGEGETTPSLDANLMASVDVKSPASVDGG